MTEKPTTRGRPPSLEWPEPIDDTPENIMKAVVNTPPKADDEWRYLQDHESTD